MYRFRNYQQTHKSYSKMSYQELEWAGPERLCSCNKHMNEVQLENIGYSMTSDPKVPCMAGQV